MKKPFTKKQVANLALLENELRELWEILTPSEKDRRSVFHKFLELQKEVQAIQQRNQILTQKENKNEHAI